MQWVQLASTLNQAERHALNGHLWHTYFMYMGIYHNATTHPLQDTRERRSLTFWTPGVAKNAAAPSIMKHRSKCPSLSNLSNMSNMQAN